MPGRGTIRLGCFVGLGGVVQLRFGLDALRSAGIPFGMHLRSCEPRGAQVADCDAVGRFQTSSIRPSEYYAVAVPGSDLRPMPVDAAAGATRVTAALRLPSHGSGPGWFGTPSLNDSFIFIATPCRLIPAHPGCQLVAN
jgi:hypothetical protein